MRLVKFVVLTLTTYGVLCTNDNEETVEDTEMRESREYGPESWRGVDKVENERLDMSGWIPQGPPSDTPETKVIRKRLRKRKRRPPHISLNDENVKSPQESMYHPRRRLRPLKLSQSDEVWEDMEQENPKRPANRRRIVPAYNSEESDVPDPDLEIITEKELNINPLKAVIQFEESSEKISKPKQREKIRDPFVALREAEEKQKTPDEIKQTTVLPHLKALLKKSGSISLSEILQQKNLSLSELLTGNIKAISALTEPPEISRSTEPSVSSETMKYHRMPPSERKKMSQNTSDINEELSDRITSNEMIEAQRKRLSLLQKHKDNKLHKGTPQTYEVTTETATERRIFVPSHPKYYSQTSYKPILIQSTTKSPGATTIRSTTTPKSIEEEKDNNSESSNTVVPPKISYHKLPITSAKLGIRITTTPKNEATPLKAIKINFDDIFRRHSTEKSSQEINDAPLKISLDLDIKNFGPTEVSLDENVDVTTEKSNEKLKLITAREEILEMLQDPNYRDRLSRILQERNMTIQELVEQRERGSSQLHLADIFHNKTREPEPVEEPHIGVIKGEYFQNVREPKSRKLGNEPKTIGIVTEKSNSAEVKNVENNIGSTANRVPNYGFETNSSFNFAAILPFWKQFHPEVFNQFYNKEDKKTWNDVHRVEEVDNRLSEVINDKLDVELRPKQYHLDEESFFDIPSGIKSALIASFAIVGLSLIMFLTILVIFKWAQRSRNKLNYASSISGAKIKSPILEMPHKSALKTFVCETLGRKHFYKNHLQSMSDVWDDKKQKF